MLPADENPAVGVFWINEAGYPTLLKIFDDGDTMPRINCKLGFCCLSPPQPSPTRGEGAGCGERLSPPTACTRNQTAAIRNQGNSPSAVSMAAFGQ